jgi:hypothetical protein
MDPWKEQFAWQAGRDKLRHWAALEGKSATMSDDLYRDEETRGVARQKTLGVLSFFAHAGVCVLEVLRFFRSG